MIKIHEVVNKDFRSNDTKIREFKKLPEKDIVAIKTRLKYMSLEGYINKIKNL